MAELTVVSLHEIEDVVAKRYRIYALLGSGGTGSTYQAEDLKTHRWVALKVMSLQQLGNWDLLTRFEREAEALGKIDHPGVPDYIEHFQVETADDCRFYLVQEFAAGKSLDKWVADGWRATEAEVKRIAAEVLNTLVYLHELDPPMIHRDIKPQNIIRQPDGRIYLVDFGAVQLVCRDALQQRGTFVGTMGYMPPEQLRGKAVFASDLYGLGATLVYLLTHRNPDELPMERMRIAFRGRVKLSEGFATWLEKMLEPMVKQRWRSATDALQALQSSYSLLSELNRTQLSHSRHLGANKNQRVFIELKDQSLIIYAKPRQLFHSQVFSILGTICGLYFLALFLSGSQILAVFPVGGWMIICFIALLAEAMEIHSIGFNWIKISPEHYNIKIFRNNKTIQSQYSLTSRILRFEVQPKLAEVAGGNMLWGEGEVASRQIYKDKLYLLLASGESLKFGGHLSSEEAIWLAKSANHFLEQQRAKASSVDPIAKMALKNKQ